MMFLLIVAGGGRRFKPMIKAAMWLLRSLLPYPSYMKERGTKARHIQ